MLNTSPSGHSGCYPLSDTHPPGLRNAPAADTACSLFPATDGLACHDHPSTHLHQHGHNFLAGHDQPCRPQFHQRGWLCLVRPSALLLCHTLSLSISLFALLTVGTEYTGHVLFFNLVIKFFFIHLIYLIYCGAESDIVVFYKLFIVLGLHYLNTYIMLV